MQINQLSDLSYSLIFCNIPNCHLQIASSVCSKWSHFGIDKGRHRQALTLFFGKEENWNLPGNENRSFEIPFQRLLLADDGKTPLYSNDNSLQRMKITQNRCPFLKENLTEQQITKLMSFYPNITTFTGILTTTSSDLLIIIRLLERWKSAMQKLNIQIVYHKSENVNSQPEELSASGALLNVINSMPYLIHLSVDSNVPLLRFGANNIDLSILSRLEELHWHSPEQADPLLDSIFKYALSNTSLRILNISPLFVDQQDRLRDLPAGFASTCFKSLRIALLHPRRGLFADPGAPLFSSLTSLTLSLKPGIPFTRTKLLRALLPLTHLLYLTLTLTHALMEAWSLEGDEELAAPPSLKVLWIVLGSNHPPEGTPPPPYRSHFLFARSQLHRFFPKLQIIRLSNPLDAQRGCTDCSLYTLNGIHDYINQLEEVDEDSEWENRVANTRVCLLEIIKPLRQFKDLQLVEVTQANSQTETFSVNEMHRW